MIEIIKWYSIIWTAIGWLVVFWKLIKNRDFLDFVSMIMATPILIYLIIK